jgi:hypothetical protein
MAGNGIKFDPILNKLRQNDASTSILSGISPLSAVLNIGNITNGSDILITHGDDIIGSSSPVSGGDVNIFGGASISGDGGDLMFAGGVTVSGEGGDLIFAGGNGTKGGDIDIFGGTSTSGGVGAVTIQNLEYPDTDGVPSAVMYTDGSGKLDLCPISALIDTSTLGITGESMTIGATRNAVANQIYLRQHNNLPTNQTPVVLPWDALLTNIVGSSTTSSTWSGEVHLNTSLVAGALVAISAEVSGIASDVNISFSKGDLIQIYCNGTSVNRPNVQAIFRKL